MTTNGVRRSSRGIRRRRSRRALPRSALRSRLGPAAITTSRPSIVAGRQVACAPVRRPTAGDTFSQCFSRRRTRRACARYPARDGRDLALDRRRWHVVAKALSGMTSEKPTCRELIGKYGITPARKPSHGAAGAAPDAQEHVKRLYHAFGPQRLICSPIGPSSKTARPTIRR
jgi:hypothetical protein